MLRERVNTRRLVMVLGLVCCFNAVVWGGQTFFYGDRVTLYSPGMDPSLSGLVGNFTRMQARYHHSGPGRTNHDAGMHNLAILEHNGDSVNIRWPAFCLEAPWDWPQSSGNAQPYVVTELQYSQSSTYAPPHGSLGSPFLGEDKAAQLTHMLDRYWGAEIDAIDAIGAQLAIWKVVHQDRIGIDHIWPTTPEWFARYEECYAYAMGFGASDGIVAGFAALDHDEWQNFIIRTSSPDVIPVPGVLGLSIVGLGGVGWLRRRRCFSCRASL